MAIWPYSIKEPLLQRAKKQTAWCISGIAGNNRLCPRLNIQKEPAFWPTLHLILKTPVAHNEKCERVNPYISTAARLSRERATGSCLVDRLDHPSRQSSK